MDHTVQKLHFYIYKNRKKKQNINNFYSPWWINCIHNKTTGTWMKCWAPLIALIGTRSFFNDLKWHRISCFFRLHFKMLPMITFHFEKLLFERKNFKELPFKRMFKNTVLHSFLDASLRSQKFIVVTYIISKITKINVRKIHSHIFYFFVFFWNCHSVNPL